jgi:hypothetical protein
LESLELLVSRGDEKFARGDNLSFGAHVKEYSPKRRTALVLSGTGTSGAYHAGVLKALDECGVKIDLVVGSGVGTIAAAYAAIEGGPKLYGDGGFWDGAGFARFYRLRPALTLALLLLSASFGVFLLPLALALVAGLLFPLVLIVDLLFPGLPARLLGHVGTMPETLGGPYLAVLAIPVFALSVLVIVYLAHAFLRDRRRFSEAFESFFDAGRAAERLRRGLWEIARGPALTAAPPSETELGRRFVALAAENLGQPGFRPVILRTADLETGRVLPFVLLEDAHLKSFAAARGARSRADGLQGAVDLRAPGNDALFFDAVATGVLPPVAFPLRRVSFPKGGLYGGETHRLTDATLVGGCGIGEALAAGAEQVIVVAAVPEETATPARRRGPRARIDGVLAALERQAVERDLENTLRINRLVETLGHPTEDGGRAWQDPVTGRSFRGAAIYAVRLEHRALGPLDLDGALDPTTEVVRTTSDLLEQGYRDAYRLFVDPVLGAAPAPRRPEAGAQDRQAVEL